MMNQDAINPGHYKGFTKEVWEMMVDIYGEEAFLNFCELNAFKYRMRAGKKEGASIEQDIKKAIWYENAMEEIMSK